MKALAFVLALFVFGLSAIQIRNSWNFPILETIVGNGIPEDISVPRSEVRKWALTLFLAAIAFFRGAAFFFKRNIWWGEVSGLLCGFIGTCCMWIVILGAKDWL